MSKKIVLKKMLNVLFVMMFIQRIKQCVSVFKL